MANDISMNEAGKLIPSHNEPAEDKNKPKRGKGKGRNQGSREPPPQGIVLEGEEIKQRLLEASSDDDLVLIRKALEMEGVNRNTIDGQVYALRKKGHLVFQTAVATTTGKHQPIEEILKSVKLPTILGTQNGQKELFDAGVAYGMKSIIAGVRLAQELSTMGVAQASPIIRMASEMRKAEGESAREAAEHAAEEVVGQAMAYMDEKLKSPKVDIATVPNPMQGIFARFAETIIDQVMTKMAGQPGASGKTALPSGWADNR